MISQVLVKIVTFFIDFANEIAEEEEIELYGKVVPVSAIEKPTPPEGEDYEWADEVTTIINHYHESCLCASYYTCMYDQHLILSCIIMCFVPTVCILMFVRFCF